MYVALYDDRGKHVANIRKAEATVTRRAYSDDSFTADGVAEGEIGAAAVAVLCSQTGRKQYASLVKSVTIEEGAAKVVGKDFRTLFDTEIRAAANSARLDDILKIVSAAVFDPGDAVILRIPAELATPSTGTDTEADFGVWTETETVNAYKKLLPYLKLYGYMLDADYDENAHSIRFAVASGGAPLSLRLEDFDHTVATTVSDVNKAVAIVERNGTEVSRKYAFRLSDNGIVLSDRDNYGEKRLYPVKTAYRSADTAYKAQYEAVKALADARYNDNVTIRNLPNSDPADLGFVKLLTPVDLYRAGAFYKRLPVSEREETSDGNGVTVTVKLGFQKTLLTQILKGD